MFNFGISYAKLGAKSDRFLLFNCLRIRFILVAANILLEDVGGELLQM